VTSPRPPLPPSPAGFGEAGTQAPRTARHSSRWIVACVLFGLALRVAFALLYWVNQPLTHDEREYLALGRSVARGEGFRYPADEPSPGTGQQFGRAPGYPLFLAALAITAPAGHAPRRVQLAQACVGALGIWLIAAIAGRVAGPRAAVTAAAIAAVYPPLVWMPSYVLSETLYSTVALAAAWVLTPSGVNAATSRTLAAPGTRMPPIPDPRSPIPVWIGAVLTGLAILIRPAMLFFVPLAALWLLWQRRTAGAILFVLIAALCVAPWTLRNHRVYGRWIAVASEGGVTFWTGNHPLARGDGDLAANVEIKRAELAFRGAHPDLTPEALEPFYYRDAFAWIRREPGAWLALLARKAFYTVVPAGPSYAVHSARYRVASVAAYLLILPAAIWGAWQWHRNRRPGPAALWLMAAATIVAGLVFFPQERFRIPVIDPALIVTAALPAGVRKR
jgi:4-amino-4-deoxy-L-arabinose transferase-like glycosyltransferase